MVNNSTKQLFSLCLSLVLTVSVTAYKCARPRPCNLAFNCSNVGDVADAVWSTDEHSCIVWRNDCQLANENCQRQNRFEKELAVIPKEDCQQLCATICTMDYRPVCGEYNGKNRIFSNPCMLRAHICSTGEIYTSIDGGPC